jgi:hypothetical protein
MPEPINVRGFSGHGFVLPALRVPWLLACVGPVYPQPDSGKMG